MNSYTLRGGKTLRSRFLAGLSYLGIFCFVPLFVNKSDEYVYFHAKQGLVIWVLTVLAMSTFYLPGIGHVVFSVAIKVLLALSVLGLISVSLRKAWKLPMVSNVAALI
ncbi:MAG: hypothetical protein H7841_18565 [Magnetospirillum sp. WYHS-4]